MSTENPFESLEQTLAFDSRDWAMNKRDAWIWGIVYGWEDYEEIAAKHNWSEEEAARLERLHIAFLAARVSRRHLGDGQSDLDCFITA